MKKQTPEDNGDKLAKAGCLALLTVFIGPWILLGAVIALGLLTFFMKHVFGVW